MARNTVLSLALLCVALVSVVAGVILLVQRDRAALLERFAAEHVVQLEAAGREVSDALGDAGEDLRFASELLLQPGNRRDHERELRAFLEAVGQYKAIAVFNAEGTPQLVLLDRRAEPSLRQTPFLNELADAARRAQALEPGTLFTSPSLEVIPGGWYRALATVLPATGNHARGAVVVLVDTEPFFNPLRLVAHQPDAHLLLFGVHGLPTPATTPALADWFGRLETEAEQVPGFASLVKRMREGEGGVVYLGEQESARLGLGKAEAIAAFTPMRVRGGGHWTAALLVSTSSLRSHERAIILRLGLAAALGVMFLVAFGAYVVVASRRAVALQESRRHADRLAHLHDTTQKILDNIPTGILGLSADGRVTTVNQVLRARLIGHAQNARLAQVFPQAPETLVARLEAMVARACAAQQVVSLQGEPLALFGEEGQYRIHAVPLERHEPDIRVLLVIEDLSDLRALETQLLRAEKLA
ncbi:MAG TPA: PAS domain-containing protein, partial [Myxococcaceae bacterium]|nr:PAS domain-containing protein [Myxococcaceae bacterium]